MTQQQRPESPIESGRVWAEFASSAIGRIDVHTAAGANAAFRIITRHVARELGRPVVVDLIPPADDPDRPFGAGWEIDVDHARAGRFVPMWKRATVVRAPAGTYSGGGR